MSEPDFLRRILTSWKIWRFKRRLARKIGHLIHTSLIRVNGRPVRVETVANPDGTVSYWSGYIKCRWWPGQHQFYIYVDDDMPHPSQLRLLGELATQTDVSRSAMEAAIFEHYKQYFSAAVPVDWEGNPLPVVRSTTELRETLCGPTINIDEPVDEEVPTWSLSFGANWDPEHGVRLEFNGTECTYVGN